MQSSFLLTFGKSPVLSVARPEQMNQIIDAFTEENINQPLFMIAGIRAACKTGRIKDIREQLNLTTNEFNPYRKRLIKKGIISGNERGFVDFMIPLFREYVLMQVED